MKTWYVYHLNCDCQSDTRVYDYQPQWKIGPRCQGCRTILGDFQVTFLGKHKAETRQKAIDEAAKKIEKTKARYFSRKKKDTNR